LGIGDWAQSPIPNPQSPIPNPQSPYIFGITKKDLIKTKFYKLNQNKLNVKWIKKFINK